MDRRILFKGKTKVQNEQRKSEWVFGGIVHQTDWYGDTVDRWFIIDGTITVDYDIGDNIEVEKETVCQYTGLHDNARWEELSEDEKEKFLSEWNYRHGRRNIKEDWNGRKIFEGDILKINEDVKEIFDISDGAVIYHGGSFIVGNGKGNGTLNSLFVIADINYVVRGKVIGNIFDNPELLKTENGG